MTTKEANTTEEASALAVLAQVKAEVGRMYKSVINYAWMNGNYKAVGLEQWERELQGIRNKFGPSWLVNARPQVAPVGWSQESSMRVETYEQALGESGIVCFAAINQPLVNQMSEIIGAMHRLLTSKGVTELEILRAVQTNS